MRAADRLSIRPPGYNESVSSKPYSLTSNSKIVLPTVKLGPTKLDKIENLHSAASVDTENLSTRGRLVWGHSSQVRLLDSSVPHNGLPERLGPLGRAWQAI